jgi:hypothetical protein
MTHMSYSPHRFLLAAALLAFAAVPVHAGTIFWDYSWHRDPIAVAADGNGTGGVTFTNQSPQEAANSSDIVATNLRVFSSASSAKPDQLVKNGAYSLTLTLKDIASGQVGMLTFTGKLTGTFSIDSADVSNAFTGPTTQSITLGGNVYTVTIGPYAPPGPPTSSNAGSIAAHVDVSSVVHVQDVPEPSGLVLCGLGGGLLALVSWRRFRRPPLVA